MRKAPKRKDALGQSPEFNAYLQKGPGENVISQKKAHSRLSLLPVCLLLLLAFLFTSCKKKEIWKTDFNEALQEAEVQGKEVFVLFSGEDWDEKTSTFRTDVLNTEEFKGYVKEKYIILNIDLSEAEQAKALAAAESDEKAKAEGEALQAQVNAKSEILSRYGVSSYPSIYILSKEGYVLSIIQYNEGINSFSVLEGILAEQAASIEEISNLVSKLASSSGAEKVRTIDFLYERTPEPARKILADLVREVPSLDPDNTSTLVGKYEFIRTYDEAVENLLDKKNDGVVDSFVSIAENGHLDSAQKFEAYYNAAYLMALLGDSDYDRMYELLKKAQEADPENDRMNDLSNLMTMVSKFRDILNEDEGPYPGLPQKEK